MSRKGDCWDNAPMESFFHTLKTEWVMHCDYKTRDDARVSLFDYMEVFYNRQRRHSSISYEAPLPFEAMQSPGKVCPPFVGKINLGHLHDSVTELTTPQDRALGLLQEWTEGLSGRPEPTTH